MNVVCSCCGQTLPPDLPFGLKLGAGQKRILDIVRRAGQHGINSADLFDKIYGDEADGGPLTGLNCLHVRIWHINRKLKTVGKVIRAGRGGRACGTQNYVLKDL